ncbi:Tektin [Cinara cedri]|uniref:Tektin n=1 Tax=Cinara cedri TaxID=506608 RepID=A0A5E4MX48_9HEMI|nr:Tektin [Cinara cedri]
MHQGNGYSSCTPLEWRYNSELEITAVEKQQELAQRLTHEADRIMKQAKDTVLKHKLEIDHQTKVKINDVEFKCNEIEKQMHDVEEEIELLFGYQTRIEKFNKTFSVEALDAIAVCLRQRKCRIGIDLVFDDIEKELLREREMILSVKDQLEDLIDKVVLQIRKLRTFAYDLRNDLQCKQNTLNIEHQNKNLNENNIDKSVLNNKNIFEPAKISVEEWNRFTFDIILAANRVLVQARPVRSFFDKIFSKILNDLVTQSNMVDQAFRLRVEEYREMIEKFKNQRLETVKNMENVEKTIDKLRMSIDDKKTSIALVHMRLLNRTRRNGVDLCRDELEVKLNEEMVNLENNVRNLKKIMAECVVRQRKLKQSIVRIDIQLEIKENSLRIDSELCAEQRKRVNYTNSI